MSVSTITWENGRLEIIDQTLLPTTYERIALTDLEQVWEAIKSLRVRGAPAIGICAAFGVLVGVKERQPSNMAELTDAVRSATEYLATSRPTAVNLFWALNRMRAVSDSLPENMEVTDAVRRLEQEATAILEEDKTLCRAIGKHGAALIKPGDGVLTHCNAGGLATGDYGTALAVMFSAHASGTNFAAYADETRPLLQGARLTAWELANAGIDVTVICDSMAAQVMREGKIQLVVVGADRIAANGDTANKIGTYSLAIAARHHQVPFYVVAPTSTIDLALDEGGAIPIEERAPEEVAEPEGHRLAPFGTEAWNPAFDVTPAELVTALVTERGVFHGPTYDLRKALAD